MHNLLTRQLEKARREGEGVDLEALAGLVTQAYQEADEDRERTDRSIAQKKEKS